MSESRIKSFRNLRFSWISGGTLLAMSLYLFLCVIHFVRGRPFWNDERAVFNSIASFQPADFFSKELLTVQVFPRFYLFCIYWVGKLFGFSVWSARLLPFISMILACGVWLRIARRQLEGSWSFLIFCLFWCASVPLIYYSAELKQYSLDVLTAGLCVLFLMDQEKSARGTAPQIAYERVLLSLPFLLLFSYPVFLFLIFPFYNQVRYFATTQGANGKIVRYAIAVLLAVAGFYLFDLRVSGANRATAVVGYGDYFISFRTLGEFFSTWGEGTINLFSRWLVEQPRIWKQFCLALMIPGLLYIPAAFYHRAKAGIKFFDSVDKIAFVLYGELFLLGVLHKYPFSVPRTSLFYCPIVFLMTIKGIDCLKTWNPRVHRGIQIFYILALSFFAIGIAGAVLRGPLGAIHPIW